MISYMDITYMEIHLSMGVFHCHVSLPAGSTCHLDRFALVQGQTPNCSTEQEASQDG